MILYKELGSAEVITSCPQSPNMKVFLSIAALAAQALAAPQLLGHGVHGGLGGHGSLGEVIPYTYNYGVADDLSGSHFSQHESDDGTGAREGSYTVLLPDGRTQHVNYHANDLTGYVAEVTYDGVGHGLGHGVGHGIGHGVGIGHGIGIGHGVAIGHGVGLGHGVGVGHGIGLGHGVGISHGVGIGHGVGVVAHGHLG